jgi:hypothetical protein
VKYAVYSLIFITGGFEVRSFFYLAFSCALVSKFWDVTGTIPGHCVDPIAQQALYGANDILNIITDILIYLPIIMLWGIRMSKESRVSPSSTPIALVFTINFKRRKATLFCIFGLGILAIAGKFSHLHYHCRKPRGSDIHSQLRAFRLRPKCWQATLTISTTTLPIRLTGAA